MQEQGSAPHWWSPVTPLPPHTQYISFSEACQPKWGGELSASNSEPSQVAAGRRCLLHASSADGHYLKAPFKWCSRSSSSAHLHCSPAIKASRYTSFLLLPGLTHCWMYSQVQLATRPLGNGCRKLLFSASAPRRSSWEKAFLPPLPPCCWMHSWVHPAAKAHFALDRRKWHQPEPRRLLYELP